MHHMYFETGFKVFKMYFQYLNTIFLYFNPIRQKNLNLRPCLEYILSVVKLYFIKGKPLSSIYNVFCLINMIKIGYFKCILGIEPLTLLQTEFK